MRVVLASAFFVLAAAGTFAFIGCGSSDNGNNGGGADGSVEGGGNKSDGGSKGDGGAAAACSDIPGSKVITVTGAIYGSPTSTPSANALCRISTADGTGCQDAVADAKGTCTFKVDPSKGPFDVTIGNSPSNLNVQAVSIMGVTDSVPGTVLQNNLSAKPSANPFKMSGKITGLGQGNRLQIDAWDFVTVVTPVQGGSADGGVEAGADGGATVSDYSSQYDYSPAIKTKIGMSAIEVDVKGNAVRGLLTPLQDRTGAPMTIDIDMSAAVPPTNTTIKVQWPTSGLLTATTIQQVDPAIVSDQHIGNCIIEKNTPDEQNAAMFVGVGNVDPPANGQSLFHLQTFGGGLSPDIAQALLTTLSPAAKMAGPNDVVAIIAPHDLTNNATLTVGAVNALGVNAPPGVTDPSMVTLDNVLVSGDTADYDALYINVYDTTKPTAPVVLWTAWVPAATLKARGLPLLPGGVQLGDIAGKGTPTTQVAISAVKYANGIPRKPWEAIGSDTLVDVGKYVTAVPQGTLR